MPVQISQITMRISACTPKAFLLPLLKWDLIKRFGLWKNYFYNPTRCHFASKKACSNQSHYGNFNASITRYSLTIDRHHKSHWESKERMASGWGITGNKGRCYDFWVDFSECMSRCREPKDCTLLREDYLECLHHSKEVPFSFTISIPKINSSNIDYLDSHLRTWIRV
jgi:NADH dehydrogenase (ubiquinone) Fe-S protein 5